MLCCGFIWFWRSHDFFSLIFFFLKSWKTPKHFCPYLGRGDCIDTFWLLSLSNNAHNWNVFVTGCWSVLLGIKSYRWNGSRSILQWYPWLANDCSSDSSLSVLWIRWVQFFLVVPFCTTSFGCSFLKSCSMKVWWLW